MTASSNDLRSLAAYSSRLMSASGAASARTTTRLVWISACTPRTRPWWLRSRLIATRRMPASARTSAWSPGSRAANSACELFGSLLRWYRAIWAMISISRSVSPASSLLRIT